MVISAVRVVEIVVSWVKKISRMSKKPGPDERCQRDIKWLNKANKKAMKISPKFDRPSSGSRICSKQQSK